MGRTPLAALLTCVLALVWAPLAHAEVFDPGSLDTLSSGTACVPTGLETVATDRPEYPAYSVVPISGSGYAPGCEVTVRVTRPDGSVVTGDGSETPGSDVVVTDVDGNLAYDYQLAGVTGSYLIEAVGDGGSVLAQVEFWDSAQLNTLTVAGVENYLVTSGETIQANGTADPNRFYRWTVERPGGAAAFQSGCLASGPGTSPVPIVNAYNVTTADLANTGNWTYRLTQYTTNTCATQDGPTRTIAFYVAKSSTFEDAAKTTPRTFFSPPGPAHVVATGLVTAGGRWDVTWILPTGATACSNTAGTDRPLAGAGTLPETGNPLLYAPAVGSPNAWNLPGNYDGACPAMASSEGAWKVKLQRDLTHFVTLPAFTADATAPNTSIDSQPSNPSGDSTPSFSFSGTDNLSAAADLTFECKLDGAAFAACSSPKDYAATADGSHTFQVRAIDQAGNVDGSPASYTWTIDTVAPDAPTIDTNPADPTNATTANFTFTGAEAGGTFECRRDAGGYGACGSPQSYSSLAEGSHTFHVRQVDAAGNEGADATFSWFVDLTAPDTSIDSQPSNPSGDSTPSFAFSGTDSHSAANQLTFECKLDGAAFAACTSPKDYAATADGSHTFQVRAIDQAGNVDGSPASYTWTIDTVKPISAASSPATTNDTAPTFEVHYTASDERSGLDKVELYASKNGGAYSLANTDSAPDESPATGTFNFTHSGDGTYRFYTSATDNAGNVEAVPVDEEDDVTIVEDDKTLRDTEAPTVTLTAPPTPTNDDTPTVAGTAGILGADDSHAADDDHVTVEILKASDDSVVQTHSNVAVNGTTGAFQVDATHLADGDYKAKATQQDGAGNSGSATLAFTVDTDAPGAPTITSGPAHLTSSNSAVFEWTGAESGGTFECRLDSTDPDDFAHCSSPEPYGALTEGDHRFEVRQVDAAGNRGPIASYDWYRDATAPNTTIDTYPPDPDNDSTPTFTFSGTDTHSLPSALTFECKVDSGSWSACSSPKTLDELTTDGSHTFQVRAIDQAGNVDGSPASYTWTLDTLAPSAPAISSPGQNSFHKVHEITLEGTADSGSTVEVFEDVGGTPTSRGTTTATGGTWSLALTVPDGSHSYKAKARDAAGNPSGDSNTRTIVVDTVKPTSAASAPGTSSTNSITVGYTANDDRSGLDKVELYASKDGGAYTLSLTESSPAGSGNFSTPFTASGDGTYRFYTRAYDKAGNVEDAPATPDATTTVTTGSVFSFTGFLKPVDDLPMLNLAKAGSSIPVKFGLGGYKGMNIFASGYPLSQLIPCDSTALVDGIDQVDSPGASGLSYDSVTQTYHWVWKTEKNWTNCRQLVVKFADGVTYGRANFKFTK